MSGLEGVLDVDISEQTNYNELFAQEKLWKLRRHRAEDIRVSALQEALETHLPTGSHQLP